MQKSDTKKIGTPSYISFNHSLVTILFVVVAVGAAGAASAIAVAVAASAHRALFLALFLTRRICIYTLE